MKKTSKKLFFYSVFASIAVIFFAAIRYSVDSVYFEYDYYRLSCNIFRCNNNDALYRIEKIIEVATENNYVCKDRNSIAKLAYQEIVKRRKYLSENNQYMIGHCIMLPTGEAIIKVGYSNSLYYVLLVLEHGNYKNYHLLDIRGRVLG